MKYYEDKSDRKMELKLLSLSEDDKLIRECMEQASAFYGCLGKMGVTEILCDRKKAQELGADCQITGIFTGGELTAFACAFEYTGLKRNGRKWLNPGDKEWRQIETLGTNVVVIPLLVGKEKVGRLIELLREQYRDSHLLFRISGEQSEKFQEDLAVVSEKNLKSHRYDAAGENVWLFHFAPQIRMEDTYFEEEILLILPGQEVLLEMGIEEAEVTMVKLTGYEIVRSEKGSAFFRKPGAACEGVLLQCDYAMEVFAAMMNYESGDVMKVFPMHDITTDGNTGSATKSSMEIRGKDDIAQIHNMYTPKPGGTPYTQVNNAAGELTKLLNAGSVDEGWLVVLTDGDFDNDIPASGLKADLEGKAAANENLYVQYLAIGTDVKNIPEGNADKGLYAQKAGNTSEVVNELAEISNRIFKRNEYAGYSSEDSGLEFDIPLRKLIVFAQGKDVKIGSLKNEEGGEVKLQSDTAVSYSSTDGAGLTTFVKSTPVKDTSLKGQVAVFADESPIVAGNYTLDVSGADSIQIYYEPDVKFEAGLYKGDTKMEEGTIEGGAYTVKVGFVDQLSGKYIKSSKLLGEPKYTVSINGETQELTGKDGASQSIDVEVDGESLELTADVNYLKDYTDSASYTFKVCTLDINVDAFKSANLKTLEDGANQITVEATRNDQPLTKEQWDAATLDVVSVNKDGEEFGIQWDVQKGSEVSTWIVTPKYKKGGMFATETGQADVTINVSAEIDGDGYGKAETVSVNIKDDKNIVDYLKRYWKHIVISLLLLILILGYVPPFKKRFARSIKKRPSIECSAEKIGLRDNVMKGNFEKDLASRLLPYVPETGRLTFSPTPVKKTAKVRASGGGSMLILNTSAFAGKEEITFNGMSIQENEKGHHRISASTIIVVSTPEFTYTCIPNVQRTANGEIKRGKRK